MSTEELNRNIPESSTEITRENILKHPDKITIMDSDEDYGLELFSYTNCKNSESQFIKNCRGLVFHGDQLVMKAFPYTDEYSHLDVQNLEKVMSNFSEWSVCKSYEGTLLRMFHFSGKWFLATHRKLSAFRSRWGCKDSFGTLFVQALEHELTRSQNFYEFMKKGWENNPQISILEAFQNGLDKNKQYTFLLRSTNSNRIVSLAPRISEPFLYHVGTFEHGALTEDNSVCLSVPPRVHVENLAELLNCISQQSIWDCQGVICFGPSNQHVKIMHDEYMHYSRVRGNEPSVKFRYLQVRNDPKTCQVLTMLYPTCSLIFQKYEDAIQEIGKFIHSAYVQRFIRRQYLTVPKEEYKVMKECHLWHVEDRTNHKISLNKVYEVLNQQSPTDLNKMIHRLFSNQTQEFPRLLPMG